MNNRINSSLEASGRISSRYSIRIPDWVPSRWYKERDYVEFEGVLHRVTREYQSSQDFLQDLANGDVQPLGGSAPTPVTEPDQFWLQGNVIGDTVITVDTGYLSLGAGDGIEFNATDAGDLITISGNRMSGATQFAPGEPGDVPAPAVGDQDRFLKGDGSWSSVPVDEAWLQNWLQTYGYAPATGPSGSTFGVVNLSNSALVNSGGLSFIPWQSQNYGVPDHAYAQDLQGQPLSTRGIITYASSPQGAGTLKAHAILYVNPTGIGSPIPLSTSDQGGNLTPGWAGYAMVNGEYAPTSYVPSSPDSTHVLVTFAPGDDTMGEMGKVTITDFGGGGSGGGEGSGSEIWISSTGNTNYMGGSTGNFGIVLEAGEGIQFGPSTGVATHPDGFQYTHFQIENFEFTGATEFVSGRKGGVPAPNPDDRNRFLRGDGGWADLPVSGDSGGTQELYYNQLSLSPTGNDFYVSVGDIRERHVGEMPVTGRVNINYTGDVFMDVGGARISLWGAQWEPIIVVMADNIPWQTLFYLNGQQVSIGDPVMCIFTPDPGTRRIDMIWNINPAHGTLQSQLYIYTF